MPDTTRQFLVNTPNLFNVAVTRSRAELHVVCDKAACTNCGIEYLEKFAHYLALPENNDSRNTGGGNNRFDSEWEQLFYERLQSNNIKTVPKWIVHQYELDLAIVDNHNNIDIEIDGELHHREITGERCINDIKRDMRLRALGWRVKRFWTYQLKYDIDECVREIQQMLS